MRRKAKAAVAVASGPSVSQLLGHAPSAPAVAAEIPAATATEALAGVTEALAPLMPTTEAPVAAAAAEISAEALAAPGPEAPTAAALAIPAPAPPLLKQRRLNPDVPEARSLLDAMVGSDSDPDSLSGMVETPPPSHKREAEHQQVPADIIVVDRPAEPAVCKASVFFHTTGRVPAAISCN